MFPHPQLARPQQGCPSMKDESNNKTPPIPRRMCFRRASRPSPCPPPVGRDSRRRRCVSKHVLRTAVSAREPRSGLDTLCLRPGLQRRRGEDCNTPRRSRWLQEERIPDIDSLPVVLLPQDHALHHQAAQQYHKFPPGLGQGAHRYIFPSRRMSPCQSGWPLALQTSLPSLSVFPSAPHEEPEQPREHSQPEQPVPVCLQEEV